MDFFDPEKQRRHAIRLMTGYVLIAFAILIATTTLLYQAYGYGFDKERNLVQSGLVFVSSTPAGSELYINGERYKSKTNTRVNLPEEDYTLQVRRNGYQTWERKISVDGGSLTRYDYPFLFPTKLSPISVESYEAAPRIVTMSPSRQWLLTQSAADFMVFSSRNTEDEEAAAETFTLPRSIASDGAMHSWQLVEWSTNNRHVLLRHGFDESFEYVLVDRDKPEESRNLTTTLKINPTELRLRDKKYDKYYAFNKDAGSLQTLTLDEPTPENYLSSVLAYQPYGDDRMLYATNTNTTAKDKVALRLLDGDDTYTLREIAASDTYLMDMARYDDHWMVAIGGSNENKVYVYKDPIEQLRSDKGKASIVQILRVEQPNFMSFSSNARFIMVENGTQFRVYDAEMKESYAYTRPEVLDAPQTHATWMDGHRITYVSNGVVVVFDYDQTNVRRLMSSLPDFVTAFDSPYEASYTVAKSTSGEVSLQRTPLRTPEDQ